MNNIAPSIFNDVIGPVMRGPSSSHTAAAVRIGKLIRQFFKGDIKLVMVEVTPDGSLASTYRSQGSEIGLIGGLLGMDPDDGRLLNALELAGERGLSFGFRITEFKADHPNTYRIRAAQSGNREFEFIFISTGGGMIELTGLNAIPVSVKGDYFETIFFINGDNLHDPQQFRQSLLDHFPDLDDLSVHQGGGNALVVIKTGSKPSENMIRHVSKLVEVSEQIVLEPVLPVLSRRNISVPYQTAAGIIEAAKSASKDTWELAVEYESVRGKIAGEEVMAMGRSIIAVMKTALKTGMANTVFADRILEPQAFRMFAREGVIFGGAFMQKLIGYITAIMETKSSMGVVVAAPTAGSCAALPGTLFAAAEEISADDHAINQALLAAGLVGVLIASKSTFAAEECGCQAECGSASAMAAAGLVQMAGGNTSQALAAASIALQNILGLVCDPVANRVEVPCLGKNILAGTNAVTAANMSLAGYSEVIPLDQTISAFDQVGRMLPPQLRCTGQAGLSITAASRDISDKLNRRG